MNLKKLAEFLAVLATLPDNEQEKVLAYAQGVSAGHRWQSPPAPKRLVPEPSRAEYIKGGEKT